MFKISLLVIAALFASSTEATKIQSHVTWDDGQWGLQRPSLFDSTGIVQELEGID